MKKQKSEEPTLEQWLDQIAQLVYAESERSSRESCTTEAHTSRNRESRNNKGNSAETPDFGVDLEALFDDLRVTEEPALQVIVIETEEAAETSESEGEVAMAEPVAIRLPKFNGNPHEDADEHLDSFEEIMMDHGVVGDKAYTARFQCTLRGAALTWMKALPPVTQNSWGIYLQPS